MARPARGIPNRHIVHVSSTLVRLVPNTSTFLTCVPDALPLLRQPHCILIRCRCVRHVRSTKRSTVCTIRIHGIGIHSMRTARVRTGRTIGMRTERTIGICCAVRGIAAAACSDPAGGGGLHGCRYRCAVCDRCAVRGHCAVCDCVARSAAAGSSRTATGPARSTRGTPTRSARLGCLVTWCTTTVHLPWCTTTVHVSCCIAPYVVRVRWRRGHPPHTRRQAAHHDRTFTPPARRQAGGRRTRQ